MSYRDKEYKTMLLTVEDGIATIQFNRPKAFNAVNEQFLDDIYEIASGCNDDPEVRVMIYTGNDKAFAAGADLKAVADLNAMEAKAFLTKVHKGVFAVEDNAKPSIAAIEGLALGGGLEIALSCDIRIFADNCTLGLPEINLGIFPGGGGTQRMPRNCALGIAKQLIFTGEFFDSALADKIGLANKVVPAAEVMPTAKKLAKQLARKAPLALREAKLSVNNSMNMDIKSGCLAEQAGWSLLFSTADQKEGMHAFLENRKATFTGK